MPLLLPLALLGVSGLENLPPVVTRMFHWLTVALFTGLALAVWACWFAANLGFPAQLAAFLQQKQPLYVPHVRVWLVAIAVALSAAWLTLIAGTTGPYRSAMIWAGGVATAWGLLGMLMVSWVDTGMTYRGMLQEMARALPADHGCITSNSIGESQRAIFEYFAGIVTDRPANASARKDCELLLVQTLEQPAPSPAESWTLFWDGARPGDYHEHFWLYRKTP
jgi:hypothetical protein